MERSWLNLRVIDRREEAEDIVSLVLAAEGKDLPPFSAGSHIDVEVGPDLTRQYSLCNNPVERDHYEIAVLLEPESRGGSKAVHEGFRIGDEVRVSEPHNHFALQSGDHFSLLLAGGIGVTPLLCMAERLSAVGAPFEFHYCARNPARAAFRERIAGSSFAQRVHYHFDDGQPEQLLVPGELFASVAGSTHVYVCGPGGFIDWIVKNAEAAGLPAAQIHREYFAASPQDAERTEGDSAFVLKIASSGETIEVGAHESAIAALARHGIEIPVSCEQGICGTCITRVIEGEPDHRDMLMIDTNDEFTPCCSRSRSPVLVIDL